MANEQNLIPQNKRTKTEQREIAKKAGLASGKARKRKKYIKENLEQLMLLDLKDSRIQENMRKMGISEEDMTIQQAISVSLVQQAMYGNIKAFQVICDMLQQNPKYGEDKEHVERNYIYCRYSYKSKRNKKINASYRLTNILDMNLYVLYIKIR